MTLPPRHASGIAPQGDAWRVGGRRDTEQSGDLAACRTLLQGGSRSFAAAARLLPRDVADSAIALYAFCRVADDLIDHNGAEAALAALRHRLQRAYDGRPVAAPADRAFAAIVARHAIPRALPEALLDGFAWDLKRRRYDTLADVLDYAARVAGSVGAMMALIMGVREPALLASACDLGMAMQLSNIARDVGEDARAGRLYLPQDWLHDVGIDPAGFLSRPAFTPALGSVVRRLVDAAEQFYLRADAGIARLPLRCRPGIAFSRLLYAAIGHEVARSGGDSVSRRVVVAPSRKLRLLLPAIARTVPLDMPLPALASDAARFLVAAVDSMPQKPVAEGRIAWVVDLFTRLEEREQMAS